MCVTELFFSTAGFYTPVLLTLARFIGAVHPHSLFDMIIMASSLFCSQQTKAVSDSQPPKSKKAVEVLED